MPPLLFSGSSHPELAKETAHLLKLSLGKIDLHLFPDKEIFVRLLEPVEKRDIFVFQSLAFNPHFYLMELLMMIDALRRQDALSINVILPYYAYGRQDRIDQPGVPITAKLIATLLQAAGIDQLITMDLHSEQIEGFYDVPLKHILSQSILIPVCMSLHLKDLVVVSPDKGGIKIASVYAKKMKVPLALLDKQRIDPFHVETNLFVGDVKGKNVLITDDMCSTGGTLVHAADVCHELGAKKIIASIGHGLFVKNALEKIDKSPIDLLITTDSVPAKKEIFSNKKIQIVSVAPLFAEQIKKETDK